MNKLKSLITMLLAISLVFSFPIQVMFKTPMPALLPYAFMVIIFSLSLTKLLSNNYLFWDVRRPIILVLSVYIILVIAQTFGQLLLGLISINSSLSALITFLAPVSFFVYFRLEDTRNLHTLLSTISIIGLVIGIYFVYDSFSMLVLGQVNDYSLSAFEYSQSRSIGKEVSDSRISVGHRSHGLLENHAVNSAWIVLGCLSTLTLLPTNQATKRALVIVVYGTLLLLGLNFTAISGFVFIIFLIEYRGYTLLRGALSKKTILLILLTLFCISFFILLFSFPLFSINSPILDIITSSLSGQVKLANGNTANSDGTYFGRMMSEFLAFLYNKQDFALGIVMGDGFSTFGRSKGGDYGIVETLHRFGIPFFLIIIIGLLKVVFRAFRYIGNRRSDVALGASYVRFSAFVIIFLLFCEVHYTVWSAKSILPILFISLAICDRYLYSARLVRRKNYTSTRFKS